MKKFFNVMLSIMMTFSIFTYNPSAEEDQENTILEENVETVVDNEETLVEEDEEIDQAVLTINYFLNETQESLAESFNEGYPVGSDYEIVSPTIENYELVDANQQVLSGTINEDMIINVYYQEVLMEEEIPEEVVEDKEETVFDSGYQFIVKYAQDNLSAIIIGDNSTLNEDVKIIGIIGPDDIELNIDEPSYEVKENNNYIFKVIYTNDLGEELEDIREVSVDQITNVVLDSENAKENHTIEILNGDMFQVSNGDELKQSLNIIESSAVEEFTICLNNNISIDDNHFGILGKKITVISAKDSNYKLDFNGNVYLDGDVTFENVQIEGASSLFANGHTVEFGTLYNDSGLRLYGGSDEDLNLLTNGDADGSTHIIIRSGKFHSIVGGNKDTFDQGKYHEYADWSDKTTNKHTTLTGNVKIDIYGGTWGGKYNIDVGDTCCNTNVTPTRMYGGGLGSDTVGDITINVYDLEGSNGTNRYNDIIVGGGFGMAGDESDTTLYDDAIKHTGNVYGNVNLNLLGGNIAEFYGGGYHGGSAYKKQLNVSAERTRQQQYHRDKVAIVTGDVNVVLGGDAVLCQNAALGYAGSYFSTIQGDINLTVKDEAKVAARKSLLYGPKTPNNMNELVKLYAEYYDGMHGGSGWNNGLFATGEYDIIGGKVNVNIEGGYSWQIYGTPFTDPFIANNFKDLPFTEIQNKNNEEAALEFNISGGMVQEVYGDYYTGKINGNIDINMTGGEVFSLTGYDGRNSSLPENSSVNIDISGGYVYNLTGSYSKIPNSITSTLVIGNSIDSNVVNVGYLEGFNDVTVAERSNVLIDALVLMENQFKIPPESYGADSDLPFYSNIYNLTIKNGATLTTCKNETNLLGNFKNENGNWIANGKVDIKKDSESIDGMIFFKEGSLIEGDAKWGNTLLCLPKIGLENNYDGNEKTDIALTVDGISSGSANVRIVEKENHLNPLIPETGENYILSKKNNDEPAEKVYTLENDEAINEGLYLKRLDDLKDSDNTYMWQVTKAKGYQVLYAFKSGIRGESLPDEIYDMLPVDDKTYTMGQTVTAIQPNQTRVELGNVIWKFEGYKEGNSQVVSDETLGPGESSLDESLYIKFNGTWSIYHEVSYEFVAADESELPSEVMAQLPQTEDVKHNTKITAPEKETFDPVETEEGTWSFVGWDRDSFTVKGNDKFVGTWEFTKNVYDISYEFVSGTDGKDLPEAVKGKLPASGNVEHGESVEATPSTFEDVVDGDGKWIFIGWDQDKVENVTDNAKFVGTWEYFGYQKVEAFDLTAYEGGVGSDGTSQNIGNALPDVSWKERFEGYEVFVGNEKWDIEEKGYPFVIEYHDEKGNVVTSSARAGVYDLIVKPLEGYENDNVYVRKDGNVKILYLPMEGLKVSSVSVRDVTNDHAADSLSDDYFKDIYAQKDIARKSMIDTLASGDYGIIHDECDLNDAHAHVYDGTIFYKNGNKSLPVNDDAEIALLWDNLLSSVLGEEHHMEMLHEKSLNVIAVNNYLDLQDNKETDSEFKYLDLVDTQDGNLWVGTNDMDVAVFWPYPKGANKDSDIALVSFSGLTRDYTIDLDAADLDKEVENSVAQIIEVTKLEDGILFNVKVNSFGPFELIWANDKKDNSTSQGPNGPSANDTPVWDDGGPFTTDICGSIYDRWGNLIYQAPNCEVHDGYKVPNTGSK